MQYITSIGATENQQGPALNKLAVTKTSYPVYFYVDIGKNVSDAAFSAGEITFTAEASHGLVPGDVIRIDSEVMYVKRVVANLITVTRGERGTVDVAHANASDIYKEQDHLSSTELEGVATDAVVPESVVAIDLKDAQFYDVILEAKVVVAQDSSTEPIKLYYAFSGYGDIDLSGTDASYLTLSALDGSLAITPPDGTPTTLYYQEAIVIPTGRYLYMWTTSHTDIVGGDTYEVYYTISII